MRKRHYSAVDPAAEAVVRKLYPHCDAWRADNFRNVVRRIRIEMETLVELGWVAPS